MMYHPILVKNKQKLDKFIQGYKMGWRCIMDCNNPHILENKIKKEFNIKFKLIAGHEYYEGNEFDILTTFNNIVIDHHNKNN